MEKAGYQTKLYDVEVESHQPKFLRVELEKIEATSIHQEFTTPSPSLPPRQRMEEQHNETIKKMTSSHHTDDFSVHEKGEVLAEEETNDHGEDYYATTLKMGTTTTSSIDSEQDEPVVSQSSKRFSSLTQLDTSFITLLRGIQIQRNNGYSSKKDCFFGIITIMLMLGLLGFRYQLAEK